MNILMIGNGFDLEHDLPTKYAEFLAFVNDFDVAYSRSKTNYIDYENISKNKYINALFNSNTSSHRINALRAFTKHNIWIIHFWDTYKNNFSYKQNWIDFESEISSVVQTFEVLIDLYRNNTLDFNASKSYEEKVNKFFLEFMQPEKVNVNIERMVNDLNRLIGALEIYIEDYINNIEIEYFSPDIATKYFDKIISFNYSETYERIYDKHHLSEYDFVHGKAKNNISFFTKSKNEETIKECIQKNAEVNNMVLGIDEYLPEDKKNKELNFIQLKKYYQRIYKRTGNKYKKWLQEIDEDVKDGIESTLYIFGHSLDVTDGDILRDLINHTGLKTVIFYKNKEQLGQQIVNLVKVLGSDTVIEKTYGEDPDISFQLQKTRESISSNSYEIERDIALLEGCYKNKTYSQSLLDKISDKIKKNELGYFRTQENVILLYEMLRTIGRLMEKERILLEIAYQLKPYWVLPPRRNLNKNDSQFIDRFIELIDYENNKTIGYNYLDL